MAGTNPAFPSADFRTAILSAARMASPNDSAMVPTFRWDTVRSFPNADVAGRPYDFNETPAAVHAIADLPMDTVVAAVEKAAEGAEGTRAGMFRPSKLTLTVIDTAWDEILSHGSGRFADAVMIGDTEYRISEIPKPDSLFDVDVWTIHAEAESVAKPS